MMRILHVNKFAFAKGGSEIYMLRAAKEQLRRGASVAVFGGRPSEASDGVNSFPVDVPEFHSSTGSEKLRHAREVVWSRPMARVFAGALDSFRPDVVHLHNYAHQLSPSILGVARSMGVPCVYTAHDYKLICPAYVASIRSKDCFRCSRRLSPVLLTHRCHQGSLSWSAVVGLEAAVVRHRRLIPDRIIAPSQFMAERLKGSWLGTERSPQTIRNPAEPTDRNWIGGGDYLLYTGRLSREKGVDELIKMAGSDLPLVIAGDGPLRSDLETLADERSTLATFLGHVGSEELTDYRRTCIAQVIPSQWPENAPLSAAEAAVDGVPLIASDRGGAPELIALGARMAVLSEPSRAALRKAITEVAETAGNIDRLRAALSWDDHIDHLFAVYEDLT